MAWEAISLSPRSLSLRSIRLAMLSSVSLETGRLLQAIRKLRFSFSLSKASR
jgi:hypothetical protein